MYRFLARKGAMGTKPLQQVRHGSMRHKIVSVEDAVHIVRSGDTITVGGFVCQNCPEEILRALEHRFLSSGGKEPRDLTVFFGGGPGDYATRGLNHFGNEGMVKRAVGSHYGQAPRLGKLALENKIEAYSFPMGSISRMLRATAGKLPGHITTIGFGTLVDPKNGGGKINKKTTEDLVVEIDILGKKYLLYKSMPVNVAMIRGTTADADGNITMERESLYNDNLVQAMAARSCGGIVMAQVERIASYESLHPRSVKIPGSLVDCVVVAKPENHWQSFITQYNPAWSSEIRHPATIAQVPLNIRKVIARRACFEIIPNQCVNLGIGVPEYVANVAEEENVLKHITLTTEPGIHGGVGARGHDFGAAVNYDALLEMNQQFDFYNGGGLNICFLGMAQVNAKGDVNVTRVGPKLTGPGGFIDISQSTKKVNLLGSFTAGDVEVEAKDGQLKIIKEGKQKKFVNKLPEVTFSGSQGVERKQSVKYITERCVFSLTPEGLELVEIAPGVDLQKDILDLMEFKPIIRGTPRLMDKRIFCDEVMDLKKDVFAIDMKSRLHYEAATNTLYVDLQGVSVTTLADAKNIVDGVDGIFRDVIKKKANLVANYDGFDCREEITPTYAAMVEKLAKDHYLSVRRYTKSAFMRHKMGSVLDVQQTAAEAAGTKETKKVSLQDIISAVHKLGLDVSANEVQTIFHRIDEDKDGFIDDKGVKQIFREVNLTRTQ